MGGCSSTSPALDSMPASRTSSPHLARASRLRALPRIAARELFSYAPMITRSLPTAGAHVARSSWPRQRAAIRQRCGIAPHARVDDGKLDVVVVARAALADTDAGPEAVHRQHRLRCRCHHEGRRYVEITSAGPVVYHVDGEPFLAGPRWARVLRAGAARAGAGRSMSRSSLATDGFIGSGEVIGASWT